MKISLVLVLVLLTLLSCDLDDKSKDVLKASITEMEDSIYLASQNLSIGTKPNKELSFSLIQRLLNFYRTFPDDSFAPECLDKVHMVYSALGDYKMSTLYGDTLLTKYKKYVNRAMILESQASTYDIYLQPRDTAMVRYYNQLLLEEYPDLPMDKIDGIKFRLDHIDLSMDELISLQADPD